MDTRRSLTTLRTVLLAGSLAFAMTVPAVALAQTGPAGLPVTAGVTSSACTLPTVNLKSMLAEARPGVKYFGYAAQAMREHDYRHAVYMFKRAAYYGYKPAEYDLGLMYFRGQGVAANRPLGAAWMVLAARSGNPYYVRAQDLLVSALTDTQFQQTNKLWNQLRKKYGQKVALNRAKARWMYVRSHDFVGSRVGGVRGDVLSGTLGPGGFHLSAGNIAPDHAVVNGHTVLTLYHGMWETNNPYAFHLLPINSATNGSIPSCRTAPSMSGRSSKSSYDSRLRNRCLHSPPGATCNRQASRDRLGVQASVPAHFSRSAGRRSVSPSSACSAADRAWSGSSCSIDITSMADLDHHHDQTIVLDFVQDAIHALADAIPLLRGQFACLRRARVVGKAGDAGQNPCHMLFGNGTQIPGHGTLEDDLKSCHGP